MKRVAASAALVAAALALPAESTESYAVSSEVFEKLPYMKNFKKVTAADFRRTRYVASAKAPEQVHIAYAGRSAKGYPTGVNVAWYYGEKTSECAVRYGLAGGSLNQTAAAPEGDRYLHHGGYHYNVDILGLRANTEFAYQVDCEGHTSEAYKFRTAIDGAELDKPFNIAVYGDMGYLGSEERPMILTIDGLKKKWSAVPVRQAMEKVFRQGDMQMVWHVGDIGYADDAFAHDIVGGLYEKCYDGYMNWMANISAQVPYMVSPGNHESECHSPECVIDPFIGKKLANFSAYNTRWHMPSRESGGKLSMWYSWNVGPVHFVSLNTETDFPGAGEEKKGDSGIYPAGSFGREGEYLAWLEADLKQAYADKKSGKRPFIVAGGHRWCCGGLGPGVQDLFNKYEVDLYVAGHAHTYARSYMQCTGPSCDGVNKGKTTYLYAGGAGNDETDLITSGPTANSSSTDPVFTTAELSFGMLTVHNSTTMQWRLVSGFGDNRNIDEFWLHAQQ